jgi:hypothetical protein
MKVIFLDVDGVLNCIHSKSRCCGYIGIDNDKVKRLRKIVEATGAKIVLTSTWKLHWIRDLHLKDEQDESGNYLDRKLRRENLFIMDKTTEEKNIAHRGEGIYNYLQHHNVENWIVLDDDVFEDYEEYGVMPHLVETNFSLENGGIQDEHVELAIALLNTEQND